MSTTVADGVDRSACPATKHGTESAYTRFGCRCGDARNATRIARKRRRYGCAQPGLISAVGTRRRIQALQAIGWTMAELDRRLGRGGFNAALSVMLTRDRVQRQFAVRVAAVYDELSMRPGPSPAARLRSARKGWLPPLAWDDIDTDPQPPRPDTDDDQVDEIAVVRAVAGRIHFDDLRRADRLEAVDRMTRSGVSCVETASRLSTSQRQVERDRNTLQNRRRRARQKGA